MRVIAAFQTRITDLNAFATMNKANEITRHLQTHIRKHCKIFCTVENVVLVLNLILGGANVGVPLTT